jgi:hypothetical protein
MQECFSNGNCPRNNRLKRPIKTRINIVQSYQFNLKVQNLSKKIYDFSLKFAEKSPFHREISSPVSRCFFAAE